MCFGTLPATTTARNTDLIPFSAANPYAVQQTGQDVQQGRGVDGGVDGYHEAVQATAMQTPVHNNSSYTLQSPSRPARNFTAQHTAQQYQHPAAGWQQHVAGQVFGAGLGSEMVVVAHYGGAGNVF